MAEDEKSRLLKCIREETEFFKSVIDFVPPEHYGYDDETKQTLQERRHSLVDGRLSAEKRATLTNKSKRRLARLDERQCRTNSQIFAYLAEIRSKGKLKKRERISKEELRRKTEEVRDKARKFVKSNKESRKEKRKSDGKAAAKPVAQPEASDAAVPKDRQHLLMKLQAKLDEMRAKRGTPTDHDKGVTFEERKRLKRRLSKAKLKERRRQEKDKITGPAIDKPNSQPQKTPPVVAVAKKKLVNGPSLNAVANHSRAGDGGRGKTKNKQQVAPTPPNGPANKRPAIVDKDGRVVFSKFDFALPGIVEQQDKDKWAKKQSGKDYKRLLDKQERLQQKMQRLEERNDQDGAKRLKEKTQWEAAINRAKGNKVKDDPNLLKKNLKRKEKLKKHSQRKWEARTDGVRRKQEEKQQKRRENIQAKRNEKRDRKLTKARKKGRLV